MLCLQFSTALSGPVPSDHPSDIIRNTIHVPSGWRDSMRLLADRYSSDSLEISILLASFLAEWTHTGTAFWTHVYPLPYGYSSRTFVVAFLAFVVTDCVDAGFAGHGASLLVVACCFPVPTPSSVTLYPDAVGCPDYRPSGIKFVVPAGPLLVELH